MQVQDSLCGGGKKKSPEDNQARKFRNPSALRFPCSSFELRGDDHYTLHFACLMQLFGLPVLPREHNQCLERTLERLDLPPFQSNLSSHSSRASVGSEQKASNAVAGHAECSSKLKIIRYGLLSSSPRLHGRNGILVMQSIVR